MKAFIHLTSELRPNGEKCKIMFNVDHIVNFCEDPNNGTVIGMIDGKNISVIENFENVREAIREVL